MLTDGRANRCDTQLDDIVDMSCPNEKPILDFSGCEGTRAMDAAGTVAETEIFGTKLAIDTRHEIQIFYIGIGEDADLDVGRILSGATGADYRTVTEDAMAEVLAEFARYF